MHPVASAPQCPFPVKQIMQVLVRIKSKDGRWVGKKADVSVFFPFMIWILEVFLVRILVLLKLLF